ncbi:MAG: site-specific integrase [Elusimicrobia bacterium]|nr:site-specific integrase [Candidatus Liberimonas magnetica]
MSVRHPPNKKWIYDFRHLGKRYRKRFKSRSAAARAEAQKRLGLNSNPDHDERITFRNAAQLFFENHSRTSKVVWKDDKSKIEYLNSLFGDKKLKDFTSFDIQCLRNNLQEKGLNSATIDKYHALIKTIFNKMTQWKRFSGPNPASEVKLKREPNAHIRCLTMDELRLLEENIKDDIVFPYYLVALHTGMRRSEICRMKWEDINMIAKTIYVPISKSGKARHIPMNDVIYDLLAELYGSGKDAQSKVLRDYDPTYISHRFIKKCKKLGIRDFRYHDLRHTFSSYLVMAGVNIHTVSRWLGHASIAMTEKNYTHLSPNYQNEEIQHLNELSIHSQESNRTTFGQLFDIQGNSVIPENQKHIEKSI